MDLTKQIVIGETDTLVFFSGIEDEVEIAKTIAAFSNSNGGTILLGVKKNGKIIGLNPLTAEKDFQNIMLKLCKPMVVYTSELIEKDLKFVLRVIIPEYSEKPISVTNQDEIYIRAENQNLKANKILLKVWKLEHLNSIKSKILTEDQKQIFELIKLFPEISLSQLYRKSQLSLKTVDRIVSDLIFSEFIEMKLTKAGSSFVTIQTRY